MRLIRSVLMILALAVPVLGWTQITSQPSPICGKAALAIPIGSNATFNWAAPTSNTDGTAITGAITYSIYSVSGPNPLLLTSGITGTSTTLTKLSAGTPCYALTATVAGAESILGPTIALLVAQVPGPPKTVTCTITLPAAVTGPTPTGAVCTVQ